MSWLRRLLRRPKGLRYPNGIPRVAQPTRIRLWDKDYNLLWSGEKFPDFITVDGEDGSRFSGPVTFRGEAP